MIMKSNVSRQVSKGAAAAALLTTLLVLPGFSGEGDGYKARKWSGTAATCIDDLVELKQMAEAAEEHYKHKNYEQALVGYRDVLKRDPGHGKAHARMGYLLITMGDYAAGQKHLVQQLKAGYKAPTAIYNMACVSSLQGDIEGAKLYLEKSVRRGFKEAGTIAKDEDIAALRETKTYHWALKAAKESSALREKIAYLKGEEHLELRAKIYSKLGEIATHDGPLQNDCGLNFLLVKQYAPALLAFERQAAAGFDVPRAYYNMACAQALAGQAEAALNSLENSVSKGMVYANVWEDSDLKNLHGMERFERAAEKLIAPASFKKKLKHASTAAERASAMQNLQGIVDDSYQSLEKRGWASFELGRLQLLGKEAKASIASFQHAAQAGYFVDEAAFQIGHAFTELGDVASAMSSFEKAVQLGYSDVKGLVGALESCEMSESKSGELLLRGVMNTAKANKEAKYLEKKGRISKEMGRKSESGSGLRF